MAKKTVPCILGIFDDEDKVLDTTRKIHQNGVNIIDVYTPYPVHGLDDAMGIKRSRLPIVTFVAGLVGFLIALGLQTWVFTSAWPINIGGKPFFSLPAFIPICFELTVLIGGLSTVAALFVRAGLFPGAQPVLPDGGITNNRFVIAVDRSDSTVDYGKVVRFLQDQGAVDVRESGGHS